MLKKTNSPKTGASGGNRQNGEFRLFNILSVQNDGIVVRFVDGKSDGAFFMEATPKFVEQKNKSPNFMAKSVGDKMHEKFYPALMRPTTNPEHQFRREVDVISAKTFPRNGTKTVEGFGELPKISLGGGFIVFARGESLKTDPFDDTIKTTTPGDDIVQGWARVVHDKEAINSQTNEKGSSWIEVINENGSPADVNELFDHMRAVAASKRGPSVFVRLLNEAGENDQQTSVYAGRAMDDVEKDIADIRALNLPASQIVSWNIQPRIYLRSEFLVSEKAGSASKLERLRRDIMYTYSVKLDETPFEADAVQRGERRAGGESFAIPMAISLTMYKNETTGGLWQAGSPRAVIPLSGELLHSKQLFMTPEQRERAALNVGAAQQPTQGAPAPQDSTPAPAAQAAAPAAPARDVDFGGDDLEFGGGN